MKILIIILILLVVMYYDKIITTIKSYDPKYKEKKAEKDKIKLLETKDKVISFKENINKQCKLSNDNMYFMSVVKSEIVCTIVDVDDTWLEVETTKGKKTIRLLLRVEDVYDISFMVD